MASAERAFCSARRIEIPRWRRLQTRWKISATVGADQRHDPAAFYIASVMFGVWHLMALTGALESLSAPGKTFDTFMWPTRLPAMAQIATFIAGTICLIIFGWKHGLKRN